MQTHFERSLLRRLGVAVAAVCLGLPIAALAQEYPKSQQATPEATIEETQPQSTVEQKKQQPSGLAALGRRGLIGKTIYGQGGDSIAEVDDVVAVNGEIQAVLIDVGGFLGFGAKTVAIALTDLELRGDRIVAPKLTEDGLAAMPTYSGVR